MNAIIKNFQTKIKSIADPVKKQAEIDRLKNYVLGLSEAEQQAYRQATITNIEQKFNTLDKLIDAYEALKVTNLEPA